MTLKLQSAMQLVCPHRIREAQMTAPGQDPGTNLWNQWTSFAQQNTPKIGRDNAWNSFISRLDPTQRQTLTEEVKMNMGEGDTVGQKMLAALQQPVPQNLDADIAAQPVPAQSLNEPSVLDDDLSPERQAVLDDDINDRMSHRGTKTPEEVKQQMLGEIRGEAEIPYIKQKIDEMAAAQPEAVPAAQPEAVPAPEAEAGVAPTEPGPPPVINTPADEAPPDADPATPGFQVPGWAVNHPNPAIAQQMQEMNAYNEKDRQFDEWAENSGFTPQQINQLRNQIHPQPQQTMQPQTQQTQQTQQPQQNTFWQDVGQGARSGAGYGAAGGAAAGAVGAGGVGAVPGAALGAGAGGLAGGAWGGIRNLYNRGKDLYNQWNQFRNQPRQPRQQQPQWRPPQYSYASQFPELTVYSSSASSMLKLGDEEEGFAMFIGSLDVDDRDALDYYINNPEENTDDLPTITAQQSSAFHLIQS